MLALDESLGKHDQQIAWPAQYISRVTNGPEHLPTTDFDTESPYPGKKGSGFELLFEHHHVNTPTNDFLIEIPGKEAVPPTKVIGNEQCAG